MDKLPELINQGLFVGGSAGLRGWRGMLMPPCSACDLIKWMKGFCFPRSWVLKVKIWVPSIKLQLWFALSTWLDFPVQHHDSSWLNSWHKWYKFVREGKGRGKQATRKIVSSSPSATVQPNFPLLLPLLLLLPFSSARSLTHHCLAVLPCWWKLTH